MKKIQIALGAIAILAAGTSVLANTYAALTTTYYRAPDTLFNTTGALCGVEITHMCVEESGVQCSHIYSTKLPGEVVATNKTYFISKKRVDNGACTTVTRFQ